LPYSLASASTQVKAVQLKVSLALNKDKFKPGEDMVFSGLVSEDGSPVSGVKAYIEVYHPIEGWQVFADADVIGGSFSVTVKCPFTWLNTSFPCRSWKARARVSGAYSGEVTFTVIYPTRISINAPSSVRVNETFTVNGVLEYEAASETWMGLPDKTVKIYLDSELLGEAITEDRGEYSLNVKISSPGTYILKAVYEGEGLITAGRYVTVGEKPNPLQAALAFTPLITIGIIIVGSEVAKHAF